MMKSFVLLLTTVAGLSQSWAQSTFTSQEVADQSQVPEHANAHYRLLIPEEKSQPMPLVVYLHGAGSKGDKNEKPVGEVLPRMFASEAVQKKFPCYVLVPQCKAGEDSRGRPNNWVKWVGQESNPPAQWETSETEASDQLGGAMAALADVLERHSIDRSRVYLTGVSMGGSGSWWWAAYQPEKFAALVTACGLSESAKAGALGKTPVWCFHGSDDPVAPAERTREMVKALQAIQAPVKYTEFKDAGHSIAGKVLTDHGVLDWLFAQRREVIR